MIRSVEAEEDAPSPHRGFGSRSSSRPIEAGARGAALVIANWEYPGYDRLNGPKHDLPLVEAGFKANRFHVTSIANVKRAEHLIDQVARFVDRILKSHEPQHGGFSGPVFIYYAGHGARSPADDKNYILPVNVDRDLFLEDQHAAVGLDDVAREIHRLKGFRVAFVLDACRDVPATRGAAAAPLPAFGRLTPDRVDQMRQSSDGGPSWLGFVFSTQPGQAAADTMAGRANTSSPFAHAFARCLRALPWQLRARRLDELFSQDVKRVFDRLDTRGQAIVVSQAGALAAPAIGGHMGRQAAILGAGGIALLGAIVLMSSFWHLYVPLPVPNPSGPIAPSAPVTVPTAPPASGSSVPPETGEQPSTPAAPVPADERTEQAPAPPPGPSAAEQRLQGRLRLAAAEDAARNDSHAIAAGLALSALDLAAFSEDEALRTDAATLLYRNLVAIRKPDTGFVVPGIPEDDGQYQFLSAFSEDGARFAIQAGQDSVRVYDTATGHLDATVKAPLQVMEIRFSPDGKMLIFLDEKAMTFQRLDKAEPDRWSIPLTGDPFREGWPSLSADGKRMADTRDPKKIVIRDTRTGEVVERPIPIPVQAVSPNFSSSGRFLSAVLPEIGIFVWEITSGRELMKYQLKKGSGWAYGEFSNDGRYLLATDHIRGIAAVLDLQTRKELKLRNAPAMRPSAARSFFLNAENDIATLHTDGTVIVWNPVNDKELARFSIGKTEVYQTAALDGGEVIAMATASKRFVAWRWRSREKLVDRPITWQEVVGFTASKAGDVVHVAEKGKLMTLPVIANGSVMRIAGFDDDAHQFALSPDRRRFAASSSGGTRLWDTRSGRLLKDTGRKPGDNMASALTFSPDDTKLFAGPPGEAGGPISVFSARHGAALPPINGEAAHRTPVQLLQSSGVMGTLLYSTGYHEFRMWDTSTGEEVRGHAFDTKGRGSIFERINRDRTLDVFAITIDPVSHALSVVDVVNGVQPEARIWMKGHTAYILGTRFSHDGKLVVSFSQDKTVRVWSVADGKQLTLRRIPEGIEDIAVSPDDAEIRILTEDATLKRWRWHEDKMDEGAHIDGCDKGQLEESLLLCRDEMRPGTPTVLRSIRPDGGFDVIARFAGKAKLIDSGHYVLEPGETATLSPTFPSLGAMKEAARLRLEPYRDGVDAALASLR